ncbi:uncharacterized protein DUF2169 [Rhodobacter viridis]|uniref:Uncharacterized protein DUF2169 n=1 Tax=Rhodobacter viridis TaxID=1054202 RepID=A0A318U5S4_9RHOB|nr:uncharacterized protein DUF2169 [Rhodobacter viridis]
MKLWALENHTPFAAFTLPDRDVQGRQHWVVAMRASFGLPVSDGFVTPLQDLPPVRLAPEYAPDGGLLHEDDILPFAPCSEVLLHGTLHPATPDARAPQSFGFRLGKLEKTAVLHPPAQAVLRSGRWRVEPLGPLAATPLRWENTFGGTSPRGQADPENPTAPVMACTRPDLCPRARFCPCPGSCRQASV